MSPKRSRKNCRSPQQQQLALQLLQRAKVCPTDRLGAASLRRYPALCTKAEVERLPGMWYLFRIVFDFCLTFRVWL